jgi:hypothetical protein
VDVQRHLGARHSFILQGFASLDARAIRSRLVDPGVTVDVVGGNDEGWDDALGPGKTEPFELSRPRHGQVRAYRCDVWGDSRIEKQAGVIPAETVPVERQERLVVTIDERLHAISVTSGGASRLELSATNLDL